MINLNDTFGRYENGKQIITLIINIFVLVGFMIEIFTFRERYLPLQMKLQVFSVVIFVFVLALQLYDRHKYYRISYLILIYCLISNIVVYDVAFPQFIESLNFNRSSFFSRNLAITLPLVGIVGFISNKRHVIILGTILIFYVIFQAIVNDDSFIRQSFLNYLLTTIGFSWVFYFLVGSNQRFIQELHESNKKLEEAQQQIIRSEKMASLGILSAGVAHEINNPLNFIQGGVLGLEKYMHSNLQGHVSELTPLINCIQVGIDRAADIVKSLNHYSRKDDLPNKACNIHNIIDNCLLMLTPEFRNNINVVREYCQGNHSVLCNESRLHQVFINILNNAIHSIDKIGTITIVTGIEGDMFSTVISDTGCGIREEILHKVTDPFFTTKEPGKGTGLGLSIVYSIIQEYKGTLNIESKEGYGTKVSVSFPKY